MLVIFQFFFPFYIFPPLFFYSLNGLVSEQSYSVTIAYTNITVIAFCCVVNSN